MSSSQTQQPTPSTPQSWFQTASPGEIYRFEHPILVQPFKVVKNGKDLKPLTDQKLPCALVKVAVYTGRLPNGWMTFLAIKKLVELRELNTYKCTLSGGFVCMAEEGAQLPAFTGYLCTEMELD